MVFACQRDSYLREFSTRVISCDPAVLKVANNGKNEVVNGFNVVLEDTILFPEGGGQSDDRGTIAGSPVCRVTREKDKAIHFVTNAVPVGEEVALRVDWTRRFDHMQQHSGQHLLSAIAENEFDLKTTSWWLGEQTSFVELDSPNVNSDVVTKMETIINEKIRLCLPVTIMTFGKGDAELDEAHTRGLPDDHVGEVRMINIEGVDNNLCCGTHVKNLSELQIIKLLSVEKGKKNKTNLHFVVGNRVIKYLRDCLDREKSFTAMLKGGPQQHVDLLDKMCKALKLSHKNEVSLIRDVATLEAEKIRNLNPRPTFYSIHKKEGNADFMNIIVNDVKDDSVLLFITVGDEKGAGQVTLSGTAELVSRLGPKIGEILNGKGVAKGNRYLGKVNDMSQRSKAEQLIRNELELLNGSVIN